jgi:DNA-binding protein H-NS
MERVLLRAVSDHGARCEDHWSYLCHRWVYPAVYADWKREMNAMAKQNLTSMSVDALLKLRDDIGTVLSQKANQLKGQLDRLGGDIVGIGRGRRGASPLMGRKAPIKYRDKSGNHWSGRGAQPRWMTAAIKDGAKREDFLVDKSSVKRARKKRRAKK